MKLKFVARPTIKPRILISVLANPCNYSCKLSKAKYISYKLLHVKVCSLHKIKFKIKVKLNFIQMILEELG